MPQSLNDSVATEVRAELGRQRISVNELARRLGCTQPYLYRRISGETPLDLTDIERIANELGMNVVRLITEASTPAAT